MIAEWTNTTYRSCAHCLDEGWTTSLTTGDHAANVSHVDRFRTFNQGGFTACLTDSLTCINPHFKPLLTCSSLTIAFKAHIMSSIPHPVKYRLVLHRTPLLTRIHKHNINKWLRMPVIPQLSKLKQVHICLHRLWKQRRN